MRAVLLVVMSGVFCIVQPGEAQTVDAPARALSISRIRGDLYQVDTDSGTTVFLLTPDGIILGDPLDRFMAPVLRRELETRLAGRAVRYIVHSHHRVDRAEGAAAFPREAVLVAHANFNAEVDEARRRSLAPFADVDVNRSGRLDASELNAAPRGADLKTYDQNGDGAVTPGELYSRIQKITSDYVSRRTIALGGKTVELIHLPPAFGTDETAVHFPDERVLFLENAPSPSQPFTFGSRRPRDLLLWLDAIAAIPFDTLLTGGGEAASATDVQALRNYIADLFAGVSAGYEAGQAIAQLQAGSWLDAHRGTVHYQRRREHIEHLYRTLRVFSFALQGSGAAASVGGTDAYCGTFAECSWGGAVPTGTAGIIASYRRVVAVAELTFAGQTLASRSSPDYDDAFAHRQSSVSVLGGYGFNQGRRLSYTLLGGASYIVADRQGLMRLKGWYLPTGGRHPIQDRYQRLAYIGGADALWSVRRGLGLVVPLRVTYMPGEASERWPGPLSVQAGIGLRWLTFRRVD
jgi:glyoxylase-like metal-dependent hydrolase (beta-lactamase superfamily II)